jgi:hypothetical protein
LPLVDLTAPPAAVRAAATARLQDEEAACGFDLAAGPLFRARLLRLENEPARHLLLLTFHHIVFDGWSIGVLTRELAALYAAALEGRPSPLPELPIQYADFALWQRAWLTGATLERLAGYWRRRLTGVPLDERIGVGQRRATRRGEQADRRQRGQPGSASTHPASRNQRRFCAGRR